jgi:hypothetical protein
MINRRTEATDLVAETWLRVIAQPPIKTSSPEPIQYRQFVSRRKIDHSFDGLSRGAVAVSAHREAIARRAIVKTTPAAEAETANDRLRLFNSFSIV